jgi:hypothetical protein
MTIDFETIDNLTRGKLGKFDTTCPACSTGRHTKANRKAKVLRIWRNEVGFATYHCAHCGEAGWVADFGASAPDPEAVRRAREKAAERAQEHQADRLRLARWLWERSLPGRGTPVETYLRSRAISLPVPPTLRYLPARGEYVHCMIGAFALPIEMMADWNRDQDPSGLAMPKTENVFAVHLTRLASAGLGKAGSDRDKIFIGSPAGYPIAVSTPSDGLSGADGDRGHRGCLVGGGGDRTSGLGGRLCELHAGACGHRVGVRRNGDDRGR